MQRLLSGVLRFRNHVFRTKRELFETLAKGQSPQALFITCSDSRICPTMITQSDPGDLFVIRNAGNIVPPAGTPGGEAASIEYAVEVLGIKDVIVCGHSHCGAMASLLDHPNGIDGLPYVSHWLRHSSAARAFVEGEHGALPREQKHQLAIEANVLLQIEHLSTHPAVTKALAAGDLDIHGWIYRFETGDILSFDLNSGRFKPLSELLAFSSEGIEPPPGLAADMRRRPMFRIVSEAEGK